MKTIKTLSESIHDDPLYIYTAGGQAMKSIFMNLLNEMLLQLQDAGQMEAIKIVINLLPDDEDDEDDDIDCDFLENFVTELYVY